MTQLQHFLRIEATRRKPPEDFGLDREPLTGAPIDPPEPKELPLGPVDDPFSTTHKIEKLKRRHKPRKPKGRGN